MASDGMLYGNAWIGGVVNHEGTLFRFDPTSSDLTVIYNYSPDTGIEPYSQLAESPGKDWLYSVASKGGTNGVGSILAIRKDGSGTPKVLLNFKLETTGGYTAAGASIDASGNYLIIGMSGGALNHVGSLVSVKIPSSVR